MSYLCQFLVADFFIVLLGHHLLSDLIHRCVTFYSTNSIA